MGLDACYGRMGLGLAHNYLHICLGLGLDVYYGGLGEEKDGLLQTISPH